MAEPYLQPPTAKIRQREQDFGAAFDALDVVWRRIGHHLADNNQRRNCLDWLEDLRELLTRAEAGEA